MPPFLLINLNSQVSRLPLGETVASMVEDFYSTTYDNLMLVGNLNAEINLQCVKLFCANYDLSSLIKVPTCYKNPEKPSCISLLLTNRPKGFQNSSVVETGLSDFHKINIAVMTTTFEKLKPRVCFLGTGTNFAMKNLGHNC